MYAKTLIRIFLGLVSKDQQGYLLTSYGTYDAMTIEAIRALNNKIDIMENEKIEQLKEEIKWLKQQLKTKSDLIDKIVQLNTGFDPTEEKRQFEIVVSDTKIILNPNTRYFFHP